MKTPSFSALIVLASILHGSSFAQSDSTMYCVLNVTSTPESAEVYLDGTLIGRTPAVCSGLATGLHIVETRKSGFVSAVDTLVLESPRVFFLDVRLTASSTLAVDSDPPGATVLLQGVSRGETPLILTDLNPGFVEVSVVKSGYAAAAQSVVLQPGLTSNLRLTLLQINGELTLETYPLDAEVLINDQSIGKGALHNYSVPSGRYHLTVRNREGGETAHDVFVPPGGRIGLRAYIDEPNNQAVWFSAVVPGLGQTLDGAWVKGGLLFGAFVGSGALFISASATVNNLESDLESKQIEYLAETGETAALQLRSELMDIHGDLESEKTTRALALGGLIAFYTINIVDALLNHSSRSGFEAHDPTQSGFQGPVFGMTSGNLITCTVSFLF